MLIIVDDEGYKIDSYSIGNNILKNLANEFSIDHQFDFINLNTSLDEHILELKIKNDDDNQLIISFDKHNFDIKKWEIYDEFQNKTVLEFQK